VAERPRIRIGVDVGGTFTDLVALIGDEIVTAKVPSTPVDQSDGVLACVNSSNVEPADVTSFAHGTTVATNALLERTGARTALVTTEGYRDIIEIGRQNRPSLYDLARGRPEPLVPRELRFAVAERMGPDGELHPLDDDDVAVIVGQLRKEGVESVAVCMLFSYLHPDHERRAAEALRAGLKDVHVSPSYEVLPEFREFERFSTTVANAYLAPKLGRYLRSLERKLTAARLPRPQVMQSSGGVIDAARAADWAAGCVISGPAAGVVAAAYVANSSGRQNVITFDMGGTSTDVATVIGGEAETTTEGSIAGVPIKLPMTDVHTVGAGGGSIATVDDGGALRVGPQSSGADPGPASYGKGGTEATVTDADLVLGYLPHGASLGGEVVLDRDLAEKAVGALAQQLALDVVEAAQGVVRVAEAEIVRALRVITVERGLDPRAFTLVAFGGAGPMHACALAEELGMAGVLIPRTSGVFSALGLAISDARRDYVRPFPAGISDLDAVGLDRRFDEMEHVAKNELGDEVAFRRRADLRYRGQSFELTIEADDLDVLADRFSDEHDRRYGFRMDSEPIEIVSVRLTAMVAIDKPALKETGGASTGRTGSRGANFDGRWIDVGVFAREEMAVGTEITGPAMVELKESTCIVRPGWRAALDDTGTLTVERRA
jgi:N-methylhydantoinase A